MDHQVTIKYCVPCRFEKQANQLSVEINAQFSSEINQVELIPTNLIGNFEVTYQGELIYSKKKTGRLPHPGEVEQILITRLTK